LWREQLEVHHPEDAFIETHITKLTAAFSSANLISRLSAGNNSGKKQSFADDAPRDIAPRLLFGNAVFYMPRITLPLCLSRECRNSIADDTTFIARRFKGTPILHEQNTRD